MFGENSTSKRFRDFKRAADTLDISDNGSDLIFFVKLEDALRAGSIVGDFDGAVSGAISAYAVSHKQAISTYGMGEVGRILNEKKRLKDLADRLNAISEGLSEDLGRLESLEYWVQVCDQADYLGPIDRAVERRDIVLSQVSALQISLAELIGEPHLMPPSPAIWEVNLYFENMADWWRSFRGDESEIGIAILADISAALWRVFGNSTAEWQSKDKPEREWARRKMEAYLKG